MKKKNWIVVIGVILVCVLITAFSIVLVNNKRTIDNLISQLESAINKHDIEKIIELYPDYCKADVVKYFSQEKLNEFYNNVILQDNKDITIKVLYVSNFDNSFYNDIMQQISEDYQENITIQDYQLVQIKYHDNFGESNLQVIKIDNKYYLYFYGNIGEPLSYFH